MTHEYVTHEDLAFVLDRVEALHRSVLARDVMPSDEWVEAVVNGLAPRPSADEVDSILARWWGSHERAHVLADWYQRGVVDVDTLRGPLSYEKVSLALDHWSDLKAGGATVGAWVRIFKATGYLSDGAPAPTEPITVYRGHPLGRWRGMSWTTDEDCAHGFAEWLAFKGPGAVFRATVPARAVLARYDGRGESEVIVNPYLLRGPLDRRGDPHVAYIGEPDPVKVAQWRQGVE